MTTTAAWRDAAPRRFRLISISSLALMMPLYALTIAAVWQHGYGVREMGWTYEIRPSGLCVSQVDPQGPAAGRLLPGDCLIASSRSAAFGPTDMLPVASDRTYQLHIRRGDTDQRVALETVIVAAPVWQAVAFVLAPVIWYGVGLFVAVARPELPTARYFFWWCFTSALVHLTLPYSRLTTLPQGILILPLAASFLVRPWNLTFAYHALYTFPPGARPGRPWRVALIALYALAPVMWLLTSVPRAAGLTPGLFWIADLGLRHPLWLYVGRAAGNLMLLLFLVAAVSVWVRNYRHMPGRDNRRRMRRLVVGSLAAALPWLVWSVSLLGGALVGLDAVADHPLFRALPIWSNFLLVLLPLNFAYAIVRHQVFDFAIVIRQSLRYVLARNVLQLLLILPLAGLAVSVLLDPNRTLRQLLFDDPTYVALAAVGAVSLRYRRPMLDVLDRRFFREQYNRETLLIELLNDLEPLGSLSQAAQLVSSRLEVALHPRGLCIWYRDARRRTLVLVHAAGAPAMVAAAHAAAPLGRDQPTGEAPDHYDHAELPANWEILHLLEAAPFVLDVPLPARVALPQEEREWLMRLDARLLVPIVGTDDGQQVVGLLMLGEKRSEEQYTPRDRELLLAIARQMARVQRTLELKDRVSESQRIRRDVLARYAHVDLVKECPRCGRCFDATTERCEDDDTELTLSVPVERIVDSKYRLDRLIGRGGMGVVYEAQDLRLDRRVAIKILSGRSFGDQAAMRRFEREARAVARLSHPHIVAIHDYGTIETEGAYLVMERLHGVTMRQELVRLGAIEPAMAVEWFSQILDGAEAAHAQGVVHRDLKPENVLITWLGDHHSHLRLLDFGVAKVQERDFATAETLSAAGMLLGTVGYMSPEQLVGGVVDPRSDIFAVGVMVYEALIGKRPFEGRTSFEVIAAVLQAPVRLEGATPELGVLEAIIQRALAKRPEERYDSSAHFREELIPALRALAAAPAPTLGPGGAGASVVSGQ